MNSECEDKNKTDDSVEMNGIQENGSPKQVSEDKMTTSEEDGSSGKDLKKSENSSVDISVTKDLKAAGEDSEDKSVCNHSVEEAGQVSDTNGDLKSGEVSKEDSKDGQPQRRMSLRPRAAPKKYKDPEVSSDDDLNDPLAVKDPLAIPISKSAATVLIRKSPTTLVGAPKSVGKTPIKAIGKVTRPPPELIKAPASSKILISPATTVSLVPRSKENSKQSGGFVIVDTQSILTGKGPVAVSSATITATTTAAAATPSVTVSAVSTKQTSSNKLIAPSILTTKKAPPAQVNSASLPDPFESLGLADDSFIVEAPSFVVPYLIEKAGPKDLKTTLAAMNPPTPKKEEVIVLSEEDSADDSDDKKDSKTSVSADKSSMKSEMEKSAVKSEKDEDNYFAGPIGRFFLDIGLSLVQEYVQGDLLRVQKRKVHKGSKISDPGLTVAALSKGLEITKVKNDAYRLPWRQCDQCNFKSELKCIMAHHWSQPLNLGSGTTTRFGCHWCPFEVKELHLAVAHIETDHGIKCRMGPERTLHQCPLCPFEDNVKSKVTRHVMSCQKRFIPDRNLEPPVDWEPPAKIPRMPAPRGMRAFPAGIANNLGYQLAGSKGLAVPYHPLLPKSALLNTLGYSVLPSATGKGGKVAIPSQVAMGNLRLPAELHIVQGSAAQRTAAAAAAAQGKTTTSYRLQSGNTTHYQNSSYAVPSNQIYQALGKSFQLLHGQGIGGSVMSVLPAGASKALAAGVSAMEKLKKVSSSNSPITLVPGLVNTSGLTIQSSTNPTAKAKTNQQPSISITPLPRSTAAASVAASKPSLSVSPVTPSTPTSGNAQTPKSAGQAATPGQKGSVVCEICDGSIKDLEQLRHHMQWIHKVKIHPKMIHNRPPLNCQKCQCRFFTDQGLERHLLGSHGLVTSSMQEAANRGQDGGRCPICGKVHQWKLLSHVVKDHGLSLKPAHLSYKCTVCTATFTMYKLFENHVYTAHSVVAKKVLDKDNKKSASSGSATPLRINDEITIIPQAAGRNNSDSSADLSVSRTCKGDSQSKRSRVDVIDLSDDEDARGDAINLPKSQVTITKVPAPIGYKNSREPLSKRSRTEDNDTE